MGSKEEERRQVRPTLRNTTVLMAELAGELIEPRAVGAFGRLDSEPHLLTHATEEAAN
jgi:hypothetical protein